MANQESSSSDDDQDDGEVSGAARGEGEIEAIWTLLLTSGSAPFLGGAYGYFIRCQTQHGASKTCRE